ncbi:MAG: guanylate kinase [Candidatus Omnitrophota bacterium]|jgi:guanylate kinase
MQKKKNQGKLFVISSPSGGGKTTLAEKALKSDAKLCRSVSMTTREARGQEVNKKDYHFVSLDFFKKAIIKKSFLEYAKVFSQYYGTPKKFVNQKRQTGKDVLLVIDVQGAEQIKRNDDSAILIFIMPPSMQVLKNRLKQRSTDAAPEIKRRLRVAQAEMNRSSNYDYVIINGDLKQSAAELKAIIIAERLRQK